MYTEEQARVMWCPFGRVDDGQIVVANRGMGNPGCVASDCMAWRWREGCSTAYVAAIKKRREETGCSLTEAKMYVDERRDELEAVTGYCGLAGQP